MQNKFKYFLYSITLSLKVVSLLMILLFVFYTNELGVAQSSVKSDFSNPLLIYGTSFGNYFQLLYKQGRFEEMLKFTAKESLLKYGRKRIDEYYRSTSFGYKMKLISHSKVNGVYILNYQCVIMQTFCIVRLTAVIENDTAKILLPFTFPKQRIFLYQ